MFVGTMRANGVPARQMSGWSLQKLQGEFLELTRKLMNGNIDDRVTSSRDS